MVTVVHDDRPSPPSPDTACAVHPQGFDDECDPCQAELSTWATFRTALHDHNKTRLQSLANQGGRIDPVMILEARINTLIEGLFREPLSSARFEAAFQAKIADTIDAAHSEMARRRLLDGVNLGVPGGTPGNQAKPPAAP